MLILIASLSFPCKEWQLSKRYINAVGSISYVKFVLKLIDLNTCYIVIAYI